MSIEELSKLENFDLELYNRDPNYRKIVDDARRIKANADEVLRDQGKTSVPQFEDIKQDPKFTKVTEVLEPPKTIPKNEVTTDFTFKDLVNIEKYDPNSPITKQLTSNKNVIVNGMWTDRAVLKKYWATKKHIKIKIANEDRFNTYTFRSVNEEQLKELQQMAEDTNNFYGLVMFEKANYVNSKEEKVPALFRNGRYYTKISELQSDYRKQLCFICLGIPEEEYETLEQFSDPEYTVNDIWGINDLIDGIYERAVKGGSYFLIAFKL
jgi:hypothetical protein